MKNLEAFWPGLRRSYLDRWPVQVGPTVSKKAQRSNAITATFQVYLLHSWRFGANEVVCRNTRLAMPCLMGARLRFGGFKAPLIVGSKHLSKVSYRVACRRLANVECEIVASILETRQSAAYSSHCRKKRHIESGDYGPSPDHRVCRCVKQCHRSLSCNFAGIPTVPRPALQKGKTLGDEGS